jgi:hypothetical protein
VTIMPDIDEMHQAGCRLIALCNEIDKLPNPLRDAAAAELMRAIGQAQLERILAKVTDAAAHAALR